MFIFLTLGWKSGIQHKAAAGQGKEESSSPGQYLLSSLKS